MFYNLAWVFGGLALLEGIDLAIWWTLDHCGYAPPKRYHAWPTQEEPNKTSPKTKRKARIAGWMMATLGMLKLLFFLFCISWSLDQVKAS